MKFLICGFNRTLSINDVMQVGGRDPKYDVVSKTVRGGTVNFWSNLHDIIDECPLMSLTGKSAVCKIVKCSTVTHI